MRKLVHYSTLSRIPFEYLRLQAFLMVLYAFGLVSKEGIGAVIVFAAMVGLAWVFAYFHVLLQESTAEPQRERMVERASRTSATEIPAPSLAWHVGFVALASAALWLLLYFAERVSVSRFGEANLPVSNATGVAVIIAVAVAVSLSMVLARRQARSFRSTHSR